MFGEEIAKCVSVGNVILVCAAVAVAVCGLFVIVNKSLGFTRSALFRKENFFTVFCIAALVALVAEATVFNFQHHLKRYAGNEIYITHRHPSIETLYLTNEGSTVFLVTSGKHEGYYGLLFPELNRPVTSIFLDMKQEILPNKLFQTTIHWEDAMGEFSYNKFINPRFPQDFHTPHQPRGDVRNLIVLFPASLIDMINGVALNKQIPLYFSGLRMFAVALLVFGFCILIRKNLRARAASFLFNYKFDPTNRRQNLVYAFSVVLLIIYSWICGYTSTPIYGKNALPQAQQYEIYLVDALIAGRTWLDYGNPEKLLEAERPYEHMYRKANNYTDVSIVPWDWAWYKGKFYCYFGVVPAVILLVPYKLLTGNYLPMHVANAIFVSAVIILLAMLWRFCVKKYMPNMRFAFYLLSFLSLFFASGLYTVIRHNLHYAIVQNAAVMFACAGAILLLKSVECGEKVSRKKLFFACLCFALIAGCRPLFLIAPFFLIPAVLWKHRSWRLVMFVTIPFVIVAIPLCIYNYVRFDSIFEFGARYNITIANVTTFGLLNPIGHVTNFFINFTHYFLYPNHYFLHFPFVRNDLMPVPWNSLTVQDSFIHQGLSYYFWHGSSLVNFPIVLCLFYYLRNLLNKHKPKTFPALSALLVGAAVIFLLNSQVTGFASRYVLDIFPYIVFPALFCAYYWGGNVASAIYLPNIQKQDDTTGQNNMSMIRMGTVYVLLTITIFVGLFLFVDGSRFFYHDNTLYRYLEYSLGIVRNI